MILTPRWQLWIKNTHTKSNWCKLHHRFVQTLVYHFGLIIGSTICLLTHRRNQLLIGPRQQSPWIPGIQRTPFGSDMTSWIRNSRVLDARILIHGGINSLRSKTLNCSKTTSSSSSSSSLSRRERETQNHGLQNPGSHHSLWHRNRWNPLPRSREAPSPPLSDPPELRSCHSRHMEEHLQAPSKP